MKMGGKPIIIKKNEDVVDSVPPGNVVLLLGEGVDGYGEDEEGMRQWCGT